MNLKSQLVTIANYLTTKTESKKHGGYNIYCDDKIYISYDTYYPNVQVNLFIDGKITLAALYSGHGNTQEFHGGAWEKYVENILFPRALEAKAAYEEKCKRREEEQRRIKCAPLNDSAVFAS